MEEQRPARGAERQVSQLVQDHEVELGQAFRDLACFALGLFLFEGVDQFNGGEEADFPAVVLDGLDAEGRRDMGLARARAADQDHVLSPVDELAAMQSPAGGFVDLAGGEVEARDVFIGREAGGLHVIGDGTDLAFGQLRLQQLRQPHYAVTNLWSVEAALFQALVDHHDPTTLPKQNLDPVATLRPEHDHHPRLWRKAQLGRRHGRQLSVSVAKIYRLGRDHDPN
jgi:hypothetical protein